MHFLNSRILVGVAVVAGVLGVRFSVGIAEPMDCGLGAARASLAPEVVIVEELAPGLPAASCERASLPGVAPKCVFRDKTPLGLVREHWRPGDCVVKLESAEWKSGGPLDGAFQAYGLIRNGNVIAAHRAAVR